jgi:outer membrane protein OmpA-like peptidoglycan-associated protein
MKLFLTFLFLIVVFGIQSQKPFVVTVYFNSNSATLTSISTKTIENFLLSNNPKETKINKIIAYCDTVGSVEFNSKLAEQRMKTVIDYFSKTSLKISEKIVAGEIYPEGATKTIPLNEWRKVEIHYSNKKPNFTSSGNGNSTSAFESLNIDSLEQKASKPIVLDIQFYPGVAVLYGISESEIDKLANFLSENPQINVLIRGHVCCNDDLPLSKARAESVYLILSDKGISIDRMKFEGYSNAIPAVKPEITDVDRQKNRRVDVIFSVPK